MLKDILDFVKNKEKTMGEYLVRYYVNEGTKEIIITSAEQTKDGEDICFHYVADFASFYKPTEQELEDAYMKYFSDLL